MERAGWAVLWRSDNSRHGKREYLIGENGNLPTFGTRQKCREYISQKYGYLRSRPDLKAEPHGWKMPIPVRVKTVIIDVSDT